MRSQEITRRHQESPKRHGDSRSHVEGCRAPFLFDERLIESRVMPADSFAFAKYPADGQVALRIPGGPRSYGARPFALSSSFLRISLNRSVSGLGGSLQTMLVFGNPSVEIPW